MTRRIKQIIKWFVISTAVLLAGVVLLIALLPSLARLGFEQWAGQHGLHGSIHEVRISLRDGRIELEQLELLDPQQHGLRLASVQLQVHLRELWQHKLVVESLRLEGLEVSAYQDSAGEWSVLGAFQETPAASPASPSDWVVSLTRTELVGAHVCIEQLTVDGPGRAGCLDLQHAAWQGQALIHGADTRLHGQMLITGLRLEDSQNRRELLSLAALAGTDLAYTVEDGLTLKQLRVQQLRALSATASEPGGAITPLLQLGEVVFAEVALVPGQHLQAAELALADLQLGLQRDPSGRFGLKDYFAPYLSRQEAATEPGNVPASPQGDAMAYRINRITLTGDNRIALEDAAVSPAFHLDLHAMQAAVGPIDTSQPALRSQFNVDLGIGEYGKLSAAGELAALAPRLTLVARATLQAVNVADLSVYAHELLQHRIKSGQLDAELAINIEQGKLASEADLTLHKFYVAELAAKQKDPYRKDLGVPLTTALSLLREKDDRIAIKLPVSGDIEAPDFALDDIVNKVMAKAIKSTIIAYYSPFGLLNLAGGVINLATALRFEPVGFAPGSVELDSQATGQLETIARLLNERPGVHLVVCGFNGQADRLALFPPPAPPGQAPALQALPGLTPLQQDALLSLATRRGETVKQALVNRLGIGADRLVTCNPELSPDDEQPPRVEISI